jgi:hypothetical protein
MCDKLLPRRKSTERIDKDKDEPVMISMAGAIDKLISKSEK